MKTSFWAIILLLLTSCQGSEKCDRLMQLADSLIENTNDFTTASTLIFDSIDTQTDKLSHRQLMRHKLLQLKVRNKQDRLTEADTAFSRVADYYRRHGSPNEQVEALYFLARVYHNMGRLPQAIDLYQQADQAADTTRNDCNWKHLFLVHSQLSQLYSDQRMPQREFKELELMEKYAWNSRDTLNALLCKVWQSDCYWALGRYDEAVEQEQKAVHLLTVNGYGQIANGCYGTIIWYLLKQGRTKEAKWYMDKYEHEAGLFDSQGNIEKGREAYYAYKGKYYLLIGQLDSAEFFFRKVLPFDGPRNNIEGGFEGLMRLYAKKGQADSVVKYASLYCDTNDKVLQSKSSEKLEHIQSMYDYSQYKKEAEIKEMQTARTILYAVVVVLLLIVIVFVLAYLYYIYRRKAQRKLEEKNLQYAETYRLYTKLLREQAAEKNKNNLEREEREKEIGKLKAILANHQEDHLRPQKWNLEASILYSEEVVSMHQYAVKGNAPDTLWIDLQNKARLYLPTFMKTIQDRQYDLSGLEQQIVLLMKLRFLGVEIQNLLGKSSQSITNSRANINKKLFNGKGVKGLDEALHGLGETIPPPYM